MLQCEGFWCDCVLANDERLTSPAARPVACGRAVVRAGKRNVPAPVPNMEGVWIDMDLSLLSGGISGSSLHYHQFHPLCVVWPFAFLPKILLKNTHENGFPGGRLAKRGLPAAKSRMRFLPCLALLAQPVLFCNTIPCICTMSLPGPLREVKDSCFSQLAG